jgi:hypothetical protein
MALCSDAPGERRSGVYHQPANSSVHSAQSPPQNLGAA